MVHPKKFLLGRFLKGTQKFKNYSEMFRLTTLPKNLKFFFPNKKLGLFEINLNFNLTFSFFPNPRWIFVST